MVATFCHNLARNLPISINNPSTLLRLVYVDDVVKSLISSLSNPQSGFSRSTIDPEYSITLSDLSDLLKSFALSRSTLMTERVGTGLPRALYATYMSYLPNDSFSYEISSHADSRGVFVEMLKTIDSGQFSFFSGIQE